MCTSRRSTLKRLVSLALCILLSVFCFNITTLADSNHEQDDTDGNVPVGILCVTLTKANNITATKVRYRIDLSCSADTQYTDLSISSLSISLTPSGTPVFSTGPLSYSLTSPSYSSTHSGIGYVTLTVGVGGSTTVYVSTASAKANFVSPYGWKNIDDLVAQPIYAYN